jgi:hypothetical protein
MFSGHDPLRMEAVAGTRPHTLKSATPDGIELGLHSGQAHHGRSLVCARQRPPQFLLRPYSPPQFPLRPLQVPASSRPRRDPTQGICIMDGQGRRTY